MRLRRDVLKERRFMKAILIVWLVGAAAVTGVVAQGNTNAAAGSGPAAAHTNVVLGVEKFMRGVDGYRGRVQVEGVVQKVSAKSKSVALIDVEEFRQCGLADCAELVLPVRWTGAMPSAGQAVRVSGEVQKPKGRLVFVASELEKVELPAKKK